MRQGLLQDARAHLLTAYQLAPQDARIAYAHALGLWPQQAEAALDVVQAAIAVNPYDVRLRNAAASMAPRASPP
ncbi:hypothetical protein D3C85_1753930 [compost metagenome]